MKKTTYKKKKNPTTQQNTDAASECLQISQVPKPEDRVLCAAQQHCTGFYLKSSLFCNPSPPQVSEFPDKLVKIYQQIKHPCQMFPCPNTPYVELNCHLPEPGCDNHSRYIAQTHTAVPPSNDDTITFFVFFLNNVLPFSSVYNSVQSDTISKHS